MWSIGSVGNLVNDIHITGASMWYIIFNSQTNSRSSGGISFGIEGQLEFSHVYLNFNLRTRYNEQAIYKGYEQFLGKILTFIIFGLNTSNVDFGLKLLHNPAIWADGLVIENSRIHNNLADGVNFAQGTKNSIVRNCNVETMAMMV